MKHVNVFHAAFTQAPVHVARVRVPDNVSDNVALEFAYSATNSVSCSWATAARTSIWIDLPKDGEHLLVTQGGIRSTMCGDMMEIGDKRFVVDTIGFKAVQG